MSHRPLVAGAAAEEMKDASEEKLMGEFPYVVALCR
jgi:hypothetical protein